MANKGENAKYFRDQENMYPSWEALVLVTSDRFSLTTS